jgi:hypothetical protein
MLSYTVSRKEKYSLHENERSKNYADTVRDQIFNIENGWVRHEGVETTFTGTIDIEHFFDKIGSAKQSISKEISPFLKGVPSEYKPVISLVLLVNGLKEVIEFKL